MAREFAVKFYNSKRWKTCREGYINTVNGMCERCLARGQYVPGYILHHKVELTPLNINDERVALGWSNLEYLCQTCHQRHHEEKNSNAAPGLRFDEWGNLYEVYPP